MLYQGKADGNHAQDDKFKALENYCVENTTRQPKEFKDIYEKTFETVHGAQMMISPSQGQFLSMLTSMRRPKVVLELGCFVGYSALWFAHGLDFFSSDEPRGHLFTIEKNEKMAKLAQKNISSTKYGKYISVINEPAANVLEKWDPNNKIDIVFIDADKAGYISYYNTIIEKNLLSKDGIIIVDNTTFRGEVLDHSSLSRSSNIEDSTKKPKLTTSEHIFNFNKHVNEDPRTDNLLLPIFDGFSMIRQV
ncbi:hypothetical protein BB560_005850, partial [Smittium megazygosporum]